MHIPLLMLSTMEMSCLFRIDYINTIKNPELLYDKQVKAIDREKALLDPKRVSEITQYILEHFEQKTYRNQSRSYYDHKVITNVEKMAKVQE